jgi:TetR/AcrR family transcriptional regulator, ethionamide resistance regulator
MPAESPTGRRLQARQTRQESRDRIVAAATELVREHSYEELSVGVVMERAGFGRTIFYRHFDDLGDLLIRASREAIEELYDAAAARSGTAVDRDVMAQTLEAAVSVYRRHGPLLRAVAEASASDPEVAAGHRAMRRMFDGLAEEALRSRPGGESAQPANLAEVARALNLMNEAYLLDAFGREPRVSEETAVRMLTEIWVAVLDHGPPGG